MKTLARTSLTIAIAALALSGTAQASDSNKPVRARDLGIPFSGEAGPLNAITDVPGIEVGQTTVIGGDTRTGVTAIHPLGKSSEAGVSAGYFAFNGTGELTGSQFIDEIGTIFGPILLTGTLGVGTARDGVLAWTDKHFKDEYTRASRIIPVIGETYDGGLSDVWKLPLSRQNVIDALEGATTGPVTEGAVGGGTGMVCYYFKCGIGTASRVITLGPDKFTLGVLVQANHGRREQLTLAGVPVGKNIPDLMPRRASKVQAMREGDGSLIVVIATDAPLLPDQLQRLARRATIGMARTGATGTTSSGDIFIAFSTATPVTIGVPEFKSYKSVPSEFLDSLLEAAAFATEESIANALVAGKDMEGRGGSFVHGLPKDRVAAMFSPGKKRSKD